ncbi:MAG: VWA domain-containing protein, partial [Chloroflexi bacterium]|nr:VWA domain-containing protein [Chloroflexota bacterium]
GQVFDLTVTVESAVETGATLIVTGGGEALVNERVFLVEGVNRFPFQLTASSDGLISFQAQIIPDAAAGDVFDQNNALTAFSQVVGAPRILLVAQNQDEIANLAPALLQQGLQVDLVEPAALPLSLATLSDYQSVVLANVPARELGPRRMELIRTYVRDLGGGLVVVGGPNAYGPGGYFMTPLEEALPVEMQLRDQERLPQLTVMYVIDKSGSMADTSVGGIPKVELAKEAILRSVALLNPLDRVGVISFDINAQQVVPLTQADNQVEIANQVARIRASGGTDIFAGLLAMSQVLPDDPGQLKHVVLLTDGGASPEGIRDLVTEMFEEHGITLSVIAIGEGYAPFIEELPQIADGRFHYAFNVDTIPEIFTEETVIATRAYIVEEPFFPALTSSSPILSGISATPGLQGYVASTIKPTAEQILVTERDDPLLAAWQYGLGRSVAWTSDATGRWATDWAGWPDYARFWSQAVRWTITEGATQNVEVRVVQDGETARIVVTAVDGDGNFINDLDMGANVITPPDLETLPIELEQVAPGRYEGTFTPENQGAYFVRIAGAADEGDAVAQTSGWVLSYSPEYRSFDGDPDYLQFITGLTGGAIVENPASILARNLPVSPTSQPVWPILLLAATILLPFDIAVRRLVITRADLQGLAASLGFGERTARQPEARTSSAAALFAAKERASQSIDQPPASESAVRETPASAAQAPAGQPTPVAPASQPDQPAARPAPRPGADRSPTSAGRSTASTLLARKRARQEDDES